MIKFCEKPLSSVDIFTGNDKRPVIAISDATGHVRFLSPELKILFWLKRPILNGLTNIKFTEKKLEPLGLEAEGEESTVEKVYTGGNCAKYGNSWWLVNFRFFKVNKSEGFF